MNPSQLLNETKPGLQYMFELDSGSTTEIRYICKVNLDNFVYIGNGNSKKEAKRNCADKILSALYPNTYKKPQNEDVLGIKKREERVAKILNINSIKTKTAAQILNELDPVVARSGRYLLENTVNNEKIFTFEIGLQNKVVTGTGKNKKIAKNEASKIAIKEFYNVDIDEIIKMNETPPVMNTMPIPSIITTNQAINSQLARNNFVKTENFFLNV